jgi:Trypsin
MRNQQILGPRTEALRPAAAPRAHRNAYRTAVLVLAAGLAGLVMFPHALGSAAQGPTVARAPADVFTVATVFKDGPAFCSGFAVSPSVIMTAGHCLTRPDTALRSASGKRPRVLRVVDVPGRDATALVTDATDLTPFPVRDLTSHAGITVFGYGVSLDDKMPGTLRRADLNDAQSDGQGEIYASVGPSGQSFCEGDSGGVAVQGDSAVGIVTAGDGKPCSTTTGIATYLAPIYEWLVRRGIVENGRSDNQVPPDSRSRRQG